MRRENRKKWVTLKEWMEWYYGAEVDQEDVNSFNFYVIRKVKKDWLERRRRGDDGFYRYGDCHNRVLKYYIEPWEDFREEEIIAKWMRRGKKAQYLKDWNKEVSGRISTLRR